MLELREIKILHSSDRSVAELFQKGGENKNNKKVEVTWESKRFWGERREGSRSSAAVAAPGPAAPGGPSRVTHGHGAGWEGVKCAVLLPGSRR